MKADQPLRAARLLVDVGDVTRVGLKYLGPPVLLGSGMIVVVLFGFVYAAFRVLCSRCDL